MILKTTWLCLYSNFRYHRIIIHHPWCWILDEIILFLTEASITSLGYYENNYLNKTAINCCFYQTWNVECVSLFKIEYLQVLSIFGPLLRRFNIKILKPMYKSRLAYKETMKWICNISFRIESLVLFSNTYLPLSKILIKFFNSIIIFGFDKVEEASFHVQTK